MPTDGFPASAPTTSLPAELTLTDPAIASSRQTLVAAYADTADDGALRRRMAGIAATLCAELVVIALLLTLGWNVVEGEPDEPAAVTFEARNVSAEESAPAEEEAEPETAQAEAEPVPRPPEPERAEPTPLDLPDVPPPQALPVSPLPVPSPAPAPVEASPKPSKPKAVIRPGRTYGPVDTGPPRSANDSERVGTAPNGEPMYAARWYREPTRQELAGYLSTATAPSSALIVCRTVPDFRVEDCELLGESPSGSQIGRAVLAATWQFRVRPAIVGGRSQVGSWVRIRIDYRQQVAR